MVYNGMNPMSSMSAPAGQCDKLARDVGSITNGAQNRLHQAVNIASRLDRLLDVLRPCPPSPSSAGSEITTGTLVEVMERIETVQDRAERLLNEIESLI